MAINLQKIRTNFDNKRLKFSISSDVISGCKRFEIDSTNCYI